MVVHITTREDWHGDLNDPLHQYTHIYICILERVRVLLMPGECGNSISIKNDGVPAFIMLIVYLSTLHYLPIFILLHGVVLNQDPPMHVCTPLIYFITFIVKILV